MGRLSQIVEGPDRHVVHNENQYLTEYFADRNADFIRRNSRTGHPYFLYAAFNAVHAPLMVTQKYYDRFPQIKNEQNRIYAAMVASLDDAVGKMLDAVEASGQADNTIVIFASDNGCAAYYPGDVQLRAAARWKAVALRGRHAGSLHDALARSHQTWHGATGKWSLCWTWFRHPPRVSGAKLPTDRVYDGVDIMPFLTGKKTGTPHDMLVWRRRPLVSIRKGDWKLWESVNDTTGKYGEYKLLFNLRTDLNETTNVAEKNPKKVQELENLIHQWAKEMSDPKWPSRPPVTYDVCGTPFTLPI